MTKETPREPDAWRDLGEEHRCPYAREPETGQDGDGQQDMDVAPHQVLDNTGHYQRVRRARHSQGPERPGTQEQPEDHKRHVCEWREQLSDRGRVQERVDSTQPRVAIRVGRIHGPVSVRVIRVQVVRDDPKDHEPQQQQPGRSQEPLGSLPTAR